MENNVTQTIIDTINTIFNNLFSSIDNELYETLDEICFIDKSVIHQSHFRSIFGYSNGEGILLIVNALLLGIILFYIVRYYISILTLSKVENPGIFIFKLFLCGIAMNCSFYIIELIIDMFANITDAILYVGKNLHGIDVNFSNLITFINSNITTKQTDVLTLEGLIKTTLSASLFTLTLSYSFRYVLIKVLAILSPFAFLCLSTNSTSIFFKTWFKNFFGLMFVQVFAAIVLDLLFALSYTSLLSKVIYLGGIYCLIKSNNITSSFFGNIETTISSSLSSFIR